MFAISKKSKQTNKQITTHPEPIFFLTVPELFRLKILTQPVYKPRWLIKLTTQCSCCKNPAWVRGLSHIENVKFCLGKSSENKIVIPYALSQAISTKVSKPPAYQQVPESFDSPDLLGFCLVQKAQNFSTILPLHSPYRVSPHRNLLRKA